MRISQKVKGVSLRSIRHFHLKTKILTDFQICINVPLNGINAKGLSKNHSIKVNNIPGGTSDAILNELDDFFKNKPDGLIVHAGTNDITKRKKSTDSRLKNRKASQETFPEY